MPFAVYCSIAAKKEKRPVRMMLSRDEDMATSGQRQCVKKTHFRVLLADPYSQPSPSSLEGRYDA